jgi:replicative DNA helicase
VTELSFPQANLDAESAVLSSLMLTQESLEAVRGVLTAEDFYANANSWIFRAICTLDGVGGKVDVVTVFQWLQSQGRADQVGGTPYLVQIIDATPAVAHVVDHAKIIADLALQRRAVARAQLMAAEGSHPLPKPVGEWIRGHESAISEIARGRDGRSAPQSLGEVTLSVVHEARDRSLRPEAERMTGPPCGLHVLDQRLAGWEAGLYVMAARPGMGKTAALIEILLGLARNTGDLSFLCSAEMPNNQLGARMLSAASRVPLEAIRMGRLVAEDLFAMERAAKELDKIPFSLAHRPKCTVAQVRSAARLTLSEERKRMNNPDLQLGVIGVDYMQIMAGDQGGGRENEVGSISRDLMALAGELNVPIIALSQLNREVEKRDDKRPRMSDLRDSGSIEQDAANILFIYRDEYYNKNSADPGIAEFILGKCRNGPTGTVKLSFRGEFARFENIIESYGSSETRYADD